MLAGKAASFNERQNMKDTEKQPTRKVVVHWDMNKVREECAKIVAEVLNAPKGTRVSGSQPLRRDK